ncbi:MAG: TetR/AcrR family transcriptional regulator [Actinomycetota bacterium]
MTAQPTARRAYDSSRRREQARATRRAVLDAARDLFVERGYVGTTVDSIARGAGVASETVYAIFGTKRAILAVLVDVTIVGDDEPVPVLDRAWVADVRHEPDPRQRLAALARAGTAILERITPIHGVLVGAAAADAEAAEQLRRYTEQRLEGQRALLRIAVPPGELRPGLSMRAAADTLFAIGSPDTYRALVIERGWSRARFEAWYAETLERLFLP